MTLKGETIKAAVIDAVKEQFRQGVPIELPTGIAMYDLLDVDRWSFMIRVPGDHGPTYVMVRVTEKY